MSSKIGPSLPRTATFRLALRHAGLFSVLSLLTFALVYLALEANLTQRVDAELRQDVREMEEMVRGLSASRKLATFKDDLDAADAGKEFRVLHVARSSLQATSDLSSWRGAEIQPPLIERLEPGRDAVRTIAVPGLDTHARVLARRTPDGDFIEFGSSLAENEEVLEAVRRILVMGWAATIVPGLLLGWFMARRAMAGVDRVTATAVHIGRSDLARRVPVGREGEEIENLARAFNGMLDRIELLLRELRDVTSNIAHDLKSPIARIRAEAEGAARRPVGSREEEPTAGLIVEECDRLAAMVDAILEIAATDAGVATPAPAAVDLAGVARDGVDLFQPVAEDKGVRLTLELPAGPLLVRGEVGRVQRVVANLLDNAIKYTGAGGTVRVSASALPGEVTLAIADSGVGIDADTLPRVFERFYRGDPSRSSPGHGLGLSLARAIVRAYGGDIAVRSAPGAGSVFTVHWPSWPPERRPQI